jgi:hypothetical protein
VETSRHIINGKLAQYPTEDRIVICCYRIKEIPSYADEIRGAVFYSGVGEIERKREIMGMLTEGEERLFWSTSALGEGIDASTIRVVILHRHGAPERNTLQRSSRMTTRAFNVRDCCSFGTSYD